MKKILFFCILSVMTAAARVPAEAGVWDQENDRLCTGISKKIVVLDSERKNGTYTAYTTANVNVRSNPDKESEIKDVLLFNTPVQVTDYNDKWCCVKDCNLYIRKTYLSRKGIAYQDYAIPKNSGFKTFMSYRKITSRSSDQYLLQDQYAYTGNYGIRQVNGRYCVAVGTAFGVGIGTYLDLILENGTVIPCVVADIKASGHTLADNITTKASGCVSEFVVDTGKLGSKVKRYGDVSKCCAKWDSPVKTIRIYEKNVLGKKG